MQYVCYGDEIFAWELDRHRSWVRRQHPFPGMNADLSMYLFPAWDVLFVDCWKRQRSDIDSWDVRESGVLFSLPA
jgi:hypothetical protein